MYAHPEPALTSATRLPSPKGLARLEDLDRETHLPLPKSTEFPASEEKVHDAVPEYTGGLRTRFRGSINPASPISTLDSSDEPEEETSHQQGILNIFFWWLETIFLTLFGPFANKES